MRLTQKILKRIIKEELDEAMKFTGGGKTLDQARADTKRALDGPKTSEPKSSGLPGVLGQLVQRYMDQGMDYGQAYQAATAERPDLADTKHLGDNK